MHMNKRRPKVSDRIPVLNESTIARGLMVFRALCDSNRLALLMRLACCGTSRNVGEMASCCPVDPSVVSRHLSTMREAGILTARRRGKEVHYSVDAKGLAALLRSFADTIEGCCCAPQNQTKKRRIP